jgi:hypothetical protein
MITDLQTWWHSLDPFWIRHFKIMMMDANSSSDKTKRDAFTPNADDLKKLVSSPEINLSSISITSLQPLLAFTEVQSLSLVSLPKLRSVTELPSLTKLKKLDIHSLTLQDFSPVSQCQGLEQLTLSTGLNSLELIRPLQNLKTLTINEPKLQNLNGIESLPLLEDLTIKQSTFYDFSLLANLKNLKRLSLDISNLATLEAITKISELQSLSIHDAPLDTLAGIENLSKLSFLTISLTNVTDLSPLNNLNPKTEIKILQNKLPLTNQVRHLNNVYVQPPIISGQPAEPGPLIEFPFKQHKHYRVIKEWYRNGTTFEVGQVLSFDHSSYNHYDDIEICYFKDLKQGYLLAWPCHTMELYTWKDYFEKVDYKN